MTREELKNKGVDFDHLVGWVANEYRDGAYQAACSEVELESGKHYNDAESDILDLQGYELIKEYQTHLEEIAFTNTESEHLIPQHEVW